MWYWVTSIAVLIVRVNVTIGLFHERYVYDIIDYI